MLIIWGNNKSTHKSRGNINAGYMWFIFGDVEHYTRGAQVQYILMVAAETHSLRRHFFCCGSLPTLTLHELCAGLGWILYFCICATNMGNVNPIMMRCQIDVFELKSVLVSFFVGLPMSDARSVLMSEAMSLWEVVFGPGTMYDKSYKHKICIYPTIIKIHCKRNPTKKTNINKINWNYLMIWQLYCPIG